uniref:Skin mucus lectin n=1 Tax=Nuchequula nuchalis TaxID=218810 RepID=Q4LE01_NUCNU|nr:skin mucus lectin [Nuchequula nuchalis]
MMLCSRPCAALLLAAACLLMNAGFSRVHSSEIRLEDLSSVRETACEGSVATLECGHGQDIHVVSANYGRLDKSTCSDGKSDFSVRNTECSGPADLVATRCNGKTSCTIEASNSVFGDPCGGTYKYLEVSYICENHVIICENDLAQLQCDDPERINVLSANYGRHDSTTCSEGRPVSDLMRTDCSMDTDSTISADCSGAHTCYIVANNDWLGGDPCSDTFKYLEVTYACQHE